MFDYFHCPSVFLLWEKPSSGKLITLLKGLKVNPKNIFFFHTQIQQFNPYVPNAPFLYPLKTSENRTGVEKECIGNKWVNQLLNGLKIYSKQKYGFYTIIQYMWIKIT